MSIPFTGRASGTVTISEEWFQDLLRCHAKLRATHREQLGGAKCICAFCYPDSEDMRPPPDVELAKKRATLLDELKSYAEPPYPHQQLDSGFGMSPVPQREGYRPDPDSTHSRADRILLELLDDEEITAAFVAIRRWYA